MTKLIISTKPKISKRVLKIFNIKNSEKLNGLFFAQKDKIIINLGSYDFQCSNSEKEIIKLFSRAITHEYVHVAIRDILGLEFFEGEEDILSRMGLYH